MKVAINTPTGNIGRALTDRLLNSGVDLVLLTRSPDKVREFADRGAAVKVGNLEEAGYVVGATKGVDVLFWLTPPNYSTDDLRSYQNELGDVAVKAVTENKIPRVVDLSSVGAHLRAGTGPIAGLGDVEKKLEKTDAHITHLRPGFFMENYFMAVETIAKDGAVYLPIKGQARMAMIATADIAQAAAERILDTTWTGRSVIELIGPADLTFEGAARTIGSALGREVKHVTTTPDQMRQALTGMGVSSKLADSFLEMYGAFDAGRVAPESPGSARIAKTTLDQFAKDVFRPGFEAMTQQK
ncbi:MAG: NAD(P)H-binding protein [Candidatus Latescibacterota bacterium]|nr:MAG: NAD(P)H-binding protein [Candidatus Latescibacterota bacterium]